MIGINDKMERFSPDISPRIMIEVQGFTTPRLRIAGEGNLAVKNVPEYVE